ncbi:MAG: hypothetical protein M3Y35_03920 [Actinomycetota bacterium]|nr:hypothetical protein [Actinomycetota bacterium]
MCSANSAGEPNGSLSPESSKTGVRLLASLSHASVAEPAYVVGRRIALAAQLPLTTGSPLATDVEARRKPLSLTIDAGGRIMLGSREGRSFREGNQ